MIKEGWVIVDVHSGRLFSGVHVGESPVFSTVGNTRVEVYSKKKYAAEIVRTLNVEPGIRLKIEKHYVKY
jgi:hypothetical protein